MTDIDSAKAGAKVRDVDWQDARRKGWHLLLMLASAYAATDSRFMWAAPVLTGAAGISAPPASLRRLGAVSMVAGAALVGVVARLVYDV